MKKVISVSVFGNAMDERVYNMDARGRELALLFVETAILKGNSVSIDVVEYDDTIPEYLKDYASI